MQYVLYTTYTIYDYMPPLQYTEKQMTQQSLTSYQYNKFNCYSMNPSDIE